MFYDHVPDLGPDLGRITPTNTAKRLKIVRARLGTVRSTPGGSSPIGSKDHDPNEFRIKFESTVCILIKASVAATRGNVPSVPLTVDVKIY